MSRARGGSELRDLFAPPLEGWGNDDLLLSERSQRSAQREDPSAFRVLYWPEFHEVFKYYEQPAKKAKREQRRLGVIAALATAAGAAGLPLITQFVPEQYWAIAAGAALLLSLIGVVLGVFHWVFHRYGRQWLSNRMMAERLRHFYFYHLLENFTEAAEAIDDGRKLPSWESMREEALERVQRVLLGYKDSIWDQLFYDRQLKWIWLSPDESMTWERARERALLAVSTLGDKADRLLAPLYSQRLLIQETYAYKAKKFSIRGFASWAKVSHWVSNVSLIGVPLLIVMASWQLISGPGSEAGQINSISACLALAAALASIGLAAKAFDRGLRAQADFNRNLEYSAAVIDLRQRYCQSARTTADKLMILFELEREAYWETREFFLTHKQDSFLG